MNETKGKLNKKITTRDMWKDTSLIWIGNSEQFSNKKNINLRERILLVTAGLSVPKITQALSISDHKNHVLRK